MKDLQDQKEGLETRSKELNAEMASQCPVITEKKDPLC
jgi:hypothetical protein